MHSRCVDRSVIHREASRNAAEFPEAPFGPRLKLSSKNRPICDQASLHEWRPYTNLRVVVWFAPLLGVEFYCRRHAKLLAFSIREISGTFPCARRCPLNKKWIGWLSDEERVVCQEIVRRLKGTSEKVMRAQVLLKAEAARRDETACEACRLRIRTQRHGEHCSVRRIAVGLSSGDLPRASHQDRLGDGSGPLVGHTLRGLRAGDADVRPPQHAYRRGVLHGVPARTSAGVGHANPVLPHPETRQLAHGG